jgi:hypothetical protein
MVEDFSVNLADPNEVRAKMPEIKGLLAQARQELHALEDQVEMLSRIVGERSSASASAASGSKSGGRGRKSPKRRPQKAAPSQEKAVQALEKAGRPMGPADLFHFMETEGIPTPSNVSALNALLWAASKSGRVMKAPNNAYAPPGGFPATTGRSVPERLPGTNGSAPPAAAQQASPNGVDPEGEGQEQGGEVGSRLGAG